MICACAALAIGPDMTRIFLLNMSLLTAHFSIEYRTHFTNFHSTVVGNLGATELLITVQVGILIPAFFAETNTWYRTPLQLPFEQPFLKNPVYADCFNVFSLLAGLNYQLTNFIVGFANAKDKVYALKALVPYF